MKDKILFHVHIPKTAGIHLWKYLNETKHSKTYTSHSKNRHYFGSYFKSKNLLDNTFSFCVVRNPWSRLYSAYNFMMNGSELPNSDSRRYLKGKRVSSFSDYLKFIDDEYEIKDLGNKKYNTKYRGNDDALFHEPQYRWFMDVEGENIILDEIYKMENLNPLYEKIDSFYGEKKGTTSKYFNNKKSNVTKDKDDYRRNFNSNEIDIVAKHYKKDIEILNYSF